MENGYSFYLTLCQFYYIYIYWKKSIPIFYVQFLLQFYCGRVCACPDPFIQSLSCFISVFNVHATLIMVDDCFSSDH